MAPQKERLGHILHNLNRENCIKKYYSCVISCAKKCQITSENLIVYPRSNKLDEETTMCWMLEKLIDSMNNQSMMLLTISPDKTCKAWQAYAAFLMILTTISIARPKLHTHQSSFNLRNNTISMKHSSREKIIATR